MIIISEDIKLREILNSDTDVLLRLMEEIYPAAYRHFWKDSGKFYVEKQYCKENILRELSAPNANYYFVLFKGEIIGNFRILWDE